ncbi:Uncharacterized protein QTN25_000790 [Entamoeba marina]
MLNSSDYLTSDTSDNDSCYIFSWISLIYSLIFPSESRKKTNKKLSVFFEDDLLDDTDSVKGFLGYLNEKKLEKEILSFRFGESSIYNGKTFSEIMKEKGFNDLIFDFDTSDYYIHRLQIYNKSIDMQHILVQLFLRCDDTMSVKTIRSFTGSIFQEQLIKGNKFILDYFKKPELSVTMVEWLRLQDFTQRCDDRMLLPSQLHSGLKLTREAHIILQTYSRKQHREGIVNTPEQWHNALQYLKLNPPFRFLNPAFEGIFLSINEAVKKDITTHGFDKVSWAVCSKCLRRRDNNARFEWIKMEQMSPLSKHMEEYFQSQEYQEMVMLNYDPNNLYIDWSLFYGKTG